MAENKQIVFRRVHGRVIPIKVRKPDESARKKFGAATVAVGLALPAGTTRLSYFMREKAGQYATRAEKLKMKAKWMARSPTISKYDPSPLFNYSRILERRAKNAKILAGYARILGKKAKRLKSAAPLIKTGGIWLGASLIGSGLARMYEEKDEPELQGTLKEIGFTAASAAAIYGSGDAALRKKAGLFLAKILSKGKIK